MTDRSASTGDGNQASCNHSVKTSMQLHSSDHPGLMRIALKAKNKLGFIDGTCEEPDPTSAEYEEWTHVDSMVISWILNSMSKEMIEAFVYTPTARALWLELEEKFGQSNGPQLYQPRRQIASIEQGNNIVVVYSNNLKKLWDEINCLEPVPKCSCNCTCSTSKKMEEINYSNRVMQFLMGLNYSFDNVRNQILVMDPLPSINKVYAMVMRVEKQRQVHINFGESVDSSALLAKSVGQSANTYSQASNRSNFKKKEGKNNGDRFCTYCNTPGHFVETCFKKNGYPDWFKDLKKQKQQKSEKTFANMADSPLEAGRDQINSLNMDTLSSSLAEIIQQELRKLVKNTQQVEENRVNAAHFGDFTEDFAGTIYSSGSSKSHYTVHGSWIIDTGASSHMCTDLTLLTHSHTPTHTSIVHLPDGNLTNQVLTVGKVMRNLYIIDHTSFLPTTISKFASCISFVPSAHCNVVAAANNKQLFVDYLDWHKRLGHPSATVMKHLPFVINSAANEICFQLQSFFKLVKTQFSTVIKSVRSDNGTEFLSQECHSFFTDLGVLHQKSCVYTPQQNGVVERKHRHLLQLAQVLIFQVDLRIKFWGDALLTTTHLINKLPSVVLSWKSPYELLFNKPPDYSYLRVFGCLSYATNVQSHKSKFSPRAHKCIFIGYAHGYKAFKLYDLDEHHTIIYQDVDFDSLDSSVSAEHSSSTDFIPSTPLSSTNQPLFDSNIFAPILQSSPSTQPLIHHSSRPKKPPNWLQDYVSNLVHLSSPHIPPAYPFVKFVNFSPTYLTYLANVSIV
ncbi:PREDICTED: uncharacterized protein LOC104599848 [Nelumbo nucifera]|uniref:Uncharacterized protein LOC104599848 n=1 Tax=Nelumbo nucifera TaxID=4432 RepID=A0A1U8AEX7_NELNU|nr:PREDICTED: uncharacterized protein LOC104599848 [Nelumbo nucifera]